MWKYALTLPNDTPRTYDYCHLQDIECNCALCEGKKTCIHAMGYIYVGLCVVKYTNLSCRGYRITDITLLNSVFVGLCNIVITEE